GISGFEENELSIVFERLLVLGFLEGLAGVALHLVGELLALGLGELGDLRATERLGFFLPKKEGHGVDLPVGWALGQNRGGPATRVRVFPLGGPMGRSPHSLRSPW